MRRRSRKARLSERTMLRIESLSRGMMGKDPDAYVDELMSLVPDLDGRLLLSLSLFGIRSEQERRRLVDQCRRLVYASASLRHRT